MNVFVGFFEVDGVGRVTVETNLTGDHRLDHAKLWHEIHKLHPTVLHGKIQKVGETIEQRDKVRSVVEYPVGATIKSLFGEDPDENGICIGTVTFNNEPCEITLRYNRGKNSAGITLRERRTGIPIRFNEPIAGMRLVREMPDALKGILAQSAREYALLLAETRPK